jgi:hypothetical protein
MMSAFVDVQDEVQRMVVWMRDASPRGWLVLAGG